MTPLQPINSLEILFENATAYAETNVELAKLKAIKTTSELLSTLVKNFIIGAIVLFFLMLLNIGISLWLGQVFGKLYYGFFIVAIFYLIVGVILYISRNSWIKKPIANKMIKQLNS